MPVAAELPAWELLYGESHGSDTAVKVSAVCEYSCYELELAARGHAMCALNRRGGVQVCVHV